jgi:hypothetical protein
MAGLLRKTRMSCVHIFLPDVDDVGTNPPTARRFGVLTGDACANKIAAKCRPAEAAHFVSTAKTKRCAVSAG